MDYILRASREKIDSQSKTSGPKMRRLIRRAPIWAAVDALSLAHWFDRYFTIFSMAAEEEESALLPI